MIAALTTTPKANVRGTPTLGRELPVMIEGEGGYEFGLAAPGVGLANVLAAFSILYHCESGLIWIGEIVYGNQKGSFCIGYITIKPFHKRFFYSYFARAPWMSVPVMLFYSRHPILIA